MYAIVCMCTAPVLYLFGLIDVCCMYLYKNLTGGTICVNGYLQLA